MTWFDGRGFFLTITVEFGCQFWHFTKCLWDFIQKRSKAVIELHDLGAYFMFGWLDTWLKHTSVNVFLKSHSKQIFSFRVAMVILYSYKDDYYKILLWKPRDCTCLGDIPLCFRQRTPRDCFYPWTNKICLEHWRFPIGRCESQRYKWISFTVVNGKPVIWPNLSQRSQNPSVFRGPQQRLTRGSLDFIALIELENLRERAFYWMCHEYR